MINNSIQYSNTFHEGYHLSHPKLLLSIWMVDLMYYLTNPLCFDVPLLDSYIDLVSSIICFLFSDDIGVFFYISIFFFSVCESVSELFCVELLVILLEILLPIKSPVVSAAFWILLFQEVLGASVASVGASVYFIHIF